MGREQQHNQDLREIYKVGGTFPPVVENFCRAFSPGPTDRPWVSEDGRILEFITS